MSLWAEWSGFDLSDDWMCLPLDAFEPAGESLLLPWELVGWTSSIWERSHG